MSMTFDESLGSQRAEAVLAARCASCPVEQEL
jgi:hypothetical protein